MNNRKKPYFMKDAKWYKFDEEKDMFVLTDLGKANERALKTYEEYVKELESDEKHFKRRKQSFM